MGSSLRKPVSFGLWCRTDNLSAFIIVIFFFIGGLVFGAELGYLLFINSIFLLLDKIRGFLSPGKISDFLGYTIIWGT
jgi:hypothetical protein